MAADMDQLLSDAHDALFVSSQQEAGTPYRDYCARLVEGFEALEQAYKAAQRELAPPARSALFWALLDAEMAAHQKAAEYRREANR